MRWRRSAGAASDQEAARDGHHVELDRHAVVIAGAGPSRPARTTTAAASSRLTTSPASARAGLVGAARSWSARSTPGQRGGSRRRCGGRRSARSISYRKVRRSAVAHGPARRRGRPSGWRSELTAGGQDEGATAHLEHRHGQEGGGPGRAARDRVLGAELADGGGAAVADPDGEGEPGAHAEDPEERRTASRREPEPRRRGRAAWRRSGRWRCRSRVRAGRARR